MKNYSALLLTKGMPFKSAKIMKSNNSQCRKERRQLSLTLLIGGEIYTITLGGQHKSNPEMCTDADFLLKVTEIPGKQAFVPSGNKKCKLERRHLRIKTEKVHLCQITESLGPQVVMSGWHSADSGKSLEVLKERSDQVRKEV